MPNYQPESVQKTQEKPKFLNWFYNLPIRQKQLIGLFTSELISVVGLVGIGTYLIITGGRQQLIEQVKSELAVTGIEYNIKINQMGFGFRGQSDNAAIINAAQAHENGEPLTPRLQQLQQQVRQILQNEVEAREIEYATLVGRDLRIIANANTNRTGELFNPNSLVSEVLTNPRQIKTSELLDWQELEQENPPLLTQMDNQKLLIRYTATPVYSRRTQTVIGVLVSGDIVNGKFPIVQRTVETLNGGYSAIYLQHSSDDFITIATFPAQESDTPASETYSTPIIPTLQNDKLLEESVANSGEIVTGREQVGTKTYTIAAKALLNYSGEPVAVLVRGTPENALNALLRSSLSTQLVITIIALTADLGLAILLGFALIEPTKRLQRVAREFAAGNLHARAEVFASDEVGKLTVTFNDMADSLVQNFHLEEQIEAQKRLNIQLSQEITDRQRAEAALKESEAQLQEKNRLLEQTLQELQATQAQIIQSEKMSSLGQLVAGVAHEINNPVNFIHGNLSCLEEYAQDLLNFVQLYQKHYPNPGAEIQEQAETIDLEFIQEDLPKILASMNIGTERIRAIVLSLRNFSRMDESEFKVVNIHEGIDSTLLILQHRLKERLGHPNIEVIKEYGDLPLVECYAGQLNQVFMNILVNAIDALEEVDAQKQHQEIIANPSQIKISTSALSSGWVEIAIADNGAGIPEELQRRIFDPFFTTKPIGKGTGMGMSISYQIITEKHGGKLDCISKPGQGAKFIIQIPGKITSKSAF